MNKHDAEFQVELECLESEWKLMNILRNVYYCNFVLFSIKVLDVDNIAMQGDTIVFPTNTLIHYIQIFYVNCLKIKQFKINVLYLKKE